MLSHPAFVHKNIILVFTNLGHKFSIRNQNIILKDSDGKIILQNSCYKVLSLWIIGNFSLTSVVLQKSKRYGFSIFLMSQNLKHIGAWNSKTEGNFLLRHKQYHNENELKQSCHIIKNKINNQIIALKNIRGKSEKQQIAIISLQNHLDKITNITEQQELLGIEGSCSRIYFSAFFENYNWQGRKPRVKHDITNVLMDMGYSYLFNYIENLTHLYGFDVYKGIFHKNFYQRKSLICDLVEPFRVIIDKQITKSYNLQQIKVDDFQFSKEQYYINYKAAKPYSKILIKAILDYKSDIFYYLQNFYRCFIQNKDINEYPNFHIK